MTDALIKVRGLSKRYGKKTVLNNLDLDIPAGRIVGLVGHNGAGKTTALKCLLGLATYQGDISVVGMSPRKARSTLMNEVCFIADTAILPKWITATKAIKLLEQMHSRFIPSVALDLLGKTDIDPGEPVSKLSKGMVTQLHLALVMAIDVPLLVLDEPTLGLDIVYRHQFYKSLMDDYFDQQKTIILATHQIEEVTNLLTDVVFLKRGEIVLHQTIDEIAERYCEVLVPSIKQEQARAFRPIYEQPGMGRTTMLFENADRDSLREFGDLCEAKIDTIFLAKMQS
ncbi:ABC transporter ATP-binding protein [Aurantivibrio plasticivorans]